MRVYRASSLGYSLERLVCPHLGYAENSPPGFLQAAYDEGNRLEPIVIEKLRSLGWVIDNEQLEVGIDVIPGVAEVVGHIDGIILDGQLSTCVLRQNILEVKSMAAKSWQDFRKHEWSSATPLIDKYKWQASCYMLATGLPHVMAVWNKETEELAFALASEPFYTISDIANKLAEAEAHINAGTIPEGCTDYPCPFYYLHGEKEQVEVTADEALEDLLIAWKDWDYNEKASKKAKDELREKIIALTGNESAAKVKGQCGVVVETYWQEGGEVIQKRQPKWVTKIQGPRAKKSSDGD